MNNNIITNENCNEHYKCDIALFKKQLSKYDKNSVEYRTLFEHFAMILMEKYEDVIEDLFIDDVESDLED